MLKYTCATNIGGRNENQDNFLVNGEAPFYSSDLNFSAYGIIEDNEVSVFAVCDGVGSFENSNFASRLTVELICERYSLINDYSDPVNWIIDVLDEADKRIRRINSVSTQCGTTATIIIIKENESTVINVGDSPAFIISEKDEITEISFRQNVATYKKIAGYKVQKRDENILMYGIGLGEAEPSRCAYIDKKQIKSGDFILLCSDGITNAFNEEDLAYVIKRGATAEQIAFKAGELDGADNCTAIIIEYYG